VLSRALIRLAPPDLEFTEIPIGNLSLYSPDHDENYPPEAMALKEAIGQSDALLFVTHEVSSESTATFLRDFMAKFREHLVSRDGRN
jgi:NAD(P)H-dependent FMN reductase